MHPLDFRLVPARPEHMDAWRALREDPACRRVLPLEPASREALLERLRDSSGALEDPRATNFRWMVEVEGALVGSVSARDLSRFQGRVEIGYLLAGTHQGRGLGTRVVSLLVDRLFTAWPFLHRVWLGTAADNLASQGLARKLGFQREGVLRQHYLIQGERRDEQVWGLLRPEWEARRSAE